MWCGDSLAKVVGKEEVVRRELGDGEGKNCAMVVLALSQPGNRERQHMKKKRGSDSPHAAYLFLVLFLDFVIALEVRHTKLAK